MSIEGSVVSTSPKPATGAEGSAGKGKEKVQSAQEGDALTAGGFFALLTSLEPQDAPMEVAATGAAIQEVSQTASALPSDPLTPLATDVPFDMAMLLTQAGQVAGDKAGAAGDARTGGAKKDARSTIPAGRVDKSDALLTKAEPPGIDKAADFRQSVSDLLNKSTQALSASGSKNAKTGELQSGAALIQAETRALKQDSLAGATAREPALSAALASTGVGAGEGLLRQVDRGVAKSSALRAGAGIEGPWGHHAFLAGSRVDTPAAPMANPPTQSFEMLVADKVNYWLAQGVQNAQLKLDGFGDESVEVSISLKGDVAHVGFRTDQPEIRQMLEGAASALKDLLTNEGLVLSGVSVGGSGQESAGAQQQGGRPATRQATIASTERAPAENQQRAHHTVGRAVDLFV